MSTTVLAAIDLAHPEHHAKILGRARKMAQMDGAKLAVVTVIPDFGMSIVGTYFQEGAEEDALKRAAEAMHQAVQAALGTDEGTQIVVRHGTAYQEILETAGMLDVGLIVMGAHRPEYRDYLLGPNAARVVRHSQCSVLVLRD